MKKIMTAMLPSSEYARFVKYWATFRSDPITKTLPKLFRLCFSLAEAVLAILVSGPIIVLGLFADWLGRYAEVAMALSRIPFYFGEHLRFIYYKFTLENLGRHVTFKYGSYCQYRDASIGNRVLIGQYCTLGEITIGDDVLIGGFVNFLSGTQQHSFSDPDKKIIDQSAEGRRRIKVGSDVWIGSNSVICEDVGDRCVVGVSSLVISPLASHGLYVGHPAHFVKNI
jgi:acetyltransferase-like isoleucine patch superfamily enzyme